MKFKTYSGEMLHDVVVSLKIDGVRAHRVGDRVLSRSGKPLYNIPALYDVCEVFTGSWESTISATRTRNGPLIDTKFLYSLEPLDTRLYIGIFSVLTKEVVDSLMKTALELGYEGLVLQEGNVRYKVKPIETYDVEVIDIIPGKGKHTGKMGALITSMGNVGTGFTDLQRVLDYQGKIIEVAAMSLTPQGKFRHPRFIRIREDK